MHFLFDGRPADSPYVEMIWRTESEGGGSFISTAASHWEMVVTKQIDHLRLTVRGPETQARIAPIPEDGEFFGIVFKLGTFMPQMPGNKLVNGEFDLPLASGHSFWLQGSAWPLPTYDNAEIFIKRMLREGMLDHDPMIGEVLQNRLPDVSVRTVRRRFLHATGLPYKTIQQIERAQQAAALLKNGTPILDAVYELGYFDQSHMTKALKLFLGQTPAQILRVSDTPYE